MSIPPFYYVTTSVLYSMVALLQMCHRNSTAPLILHPPAQLGTKDENFSTQRYKQTLQPIDKPIKLKSEENLEVNEAKTEKPILEKKNKIKFKCEQEHEAKWRAEKKIVSLYGDSGELSRRKQLSVTALNKLRLTLGMHKCMRGGNRNRGERLWTKI